MPQKSEIFMGHHFLPNGALVIMEEGDTVLCSFRSEYVTWRIDKDGNAFLGHYFRSFSQAFNSFQARKSMRLTQMPGEGR